MLWKIFPSRQINQPTARDLTPKASTRCAFKRGSPPEPFPLIEVQHPGGGKKTKNVYSLLRQPLRSVELSASGCEAQILRIYLIARRKPRQPRRRSRSTKAAAPHRTASHLSIRNPLRIVPGAIRNPLRISPGLTRNRLRPGLSFQMGTRARSQPAIRNPLRIHPQARIQPKIVNWMMKVIRNPQHISPSTVVLGGPSVLWKATGSPVFRPATRNALRTPQSNLVWMRR